MCTFDTGIFTVFYPFYHQILCDEMGLGKSIQTISLILLAPPTGLEYKAPAINSEAAKLPSGPTKRCTLIVCPVSVLSNWTEQIEQFVAPGVLSVELYHGANRHSILADVKEGNVDVLLVSYNTLGKYCIVNNTVFLPILSHLSSSIYHICSCGLRCIGKGIRA